MSSPSAAHHIINGAHGPIGGGAAPSNGAAGDNQSNLSTANGHLSAAPSPSGLLSVPGTPGTPRQFVSSDIGYHDIVFSGKKAQASRVESKIKELGFIPDGLVKGEVEWFFSSLGIDDGYFQNTSVEEIVSHIVSLYGSKVQAYARADHKLKINLEKEGEKSALYINTSTPGVTDLDGPNVEQRIDEKYLDNSTPQKAYRLETYRSSGNPSKGLAHQLRCYFVAQCEFENPNPDPEESDIRKVSAKSFLEKVSPNTLDIYQEVMTHALQRTGPIVECYEVEGTRERRVVIGYKQGKVSSFFSALSNLYHFYGLFSARKYVEQFSNGYTIISLYLNPLNRGPPIEASIYQIMREASLLFCLPKNPFYTPSSGHAVQEAAYANAGWIFAQHFLNRLGSPYLALKKIVNENDASQAQILNDLRTKLRAETFTRQSILEVIQSYPELIRLLYIQFAMTHYIQAQGAQLMPTLSYQRLHTQQVLSEEELQNRVKRSAANTHDHEVLQSFLIFNKAILKTNFYQPTKVALSFRLDPSFLPDMEYPNKPYGLFFVIGSQFRGFHLRFKDVARGGIRIIRSRNKEAYSINVRNLFDENYALASTQALKNKDIPEGGAKGVILPDLDANPRVCFESYVDSILDLLIPGVSPGIKEKIVDLYDKEEILFFGPDEGTADMMDWAALHARERGMPGWKSFTTGKGQAQLGGIPHDLFGMTSLSVRQYIVGIYRELGLDEKNITKVQTGGPDGDLGSNEILLSKDKTITIIDGAGVLHDPLGLDREELTRLAKERKMCNHFDASKLSKDGYRILVEDQDFKLPSGEIIADGADFRNNAHFRYKSDIFVPCGGRPEAINISNVSRLFDEEGRCNFKYIVEGANLFITQQARLALEKKGVILFKDASANKGGVTSSSLEVLAGLGLEDEEFITLMTSQQEEGFSDFYIDYVQAIQKVISDNAASEFSAMWKEHQETKRPLTLISDDIGRQLIDLQNELENSELWNYDPEVRKRVLALGMPKPLVDHVGLDKLIERLPEQYAKSIFSSYVASRFLYRYGVRASSVQFLMHITSIKDSKAL